jgi:hypothetical protein
MQRTQPKDPAAAHLTTLMQQMMALKLRHKQGTVVKFMEAGNHERSKGHAGDMKDDELKRVADIG